MHAGDADPGRQFYEEHVALLQSGDADGLVDTHYAPDAVLISFDNVIRGREALREHFRAYLQMLGRLEVLSTDQFVSVPEGVFFTASVRTARGEAKVFDAMVIRDGMIEQHFTGVFP